MSEANLNDYMTDSQGRLVHKDNVKEIDKTRDGLVRNVVDNALAVQKEMAKFKDMAMSEIDAFVEMSASDYGVSLGGRKGNLNMFSYDGRYKIQVQVSEYVVPDERLNAAKALIDKLLNSWTQDSRSEVKTIINDAFAVDQEGKFNLRRILGLRRLEIVDPDWKKAMDAISDSLQVIGSKRYMRVYERVGNQDQWRPISLDFAAL
ncbi:DUF3164 family protein [uncultured Desulfobacter sp.]|uniref:DUF3164 family protein n=1 Tax=uncultured Desulfobacter sp. TaxID=240139 RepID=UPI002AAB7506|nr:DUF3164 family protein [uncultured Desulfobacter sp.]